MSSEVEWEFKIIPSQLVLFSMPGIVNILSSLDFGLAEKGERTDAFLLHYCKYLIGDSEELSIIWSKVKKIKLINNTTGTKDRVSLCIICDASASLMQNRGNP